MNTRSEIRYLSLCGMLGYGYAAEEFQRHLEDGWDFIGVDAGSTDPGPYYLGSGRGFVKEAQTRRDLEPALVAAVRLGIPLILGSAGGSGARPHVERTVALVRELARRNGLHARMAVLYSDLSRARVAAALRRGRVSPCGGAPELTPEQFAQTGRIVAQFGTEPIAEALKAGAQIVVAGRCCDTAIFAALPILRGFPAGLALHAAKIAECGALCAVPAGANDSLAVTLTHQDFRVEPLNPARTCTPDSVAAHSLYEQPRPDGFDEPEGRVDLRHAVFRQDGDRAVRVSGSVLIPPRTATLKLEGTRRVGFRSFTIAGTRDPGVIASLDAIQSQVAETVARTLAGVLDPALYTLRFLRYGLDAVPFGRIAPGPPPAEVGLLIEAVAPSQDAADLVVSLARSTALHQGFPGRKTSAGNLAFPFSPSDFRGGPVYEFSVYHLLQVGAPSAAGVPRTVYEEL